MFSVLSLAIGSVFCAVAIFTQNPVMDARAWVVAPMFICTSFILFTLETYLGDGE